LWLYEYDFKKFEISTTTGIAETELEKAAKSLITYWNSGEELLDITVVKNDKNFSLFNYEEIFHMKDVKGLVRLDYTILFGTLIYALVYSGVGLFFCRGKHRRQLVNGILWGSGLTLAIMLVLWLGALINFDWLFLQFHLLSFTNEFWSAEGYMVMLFPPGFWFDAAIFVALGTAGMAIILGGTAVAYLLTGRKT